MRVCDSVAYGPLPLPATTVDERTWRNAIVTRLAWLAHQTILGLPNLTEPTVAELAMLLCEIYKNSSIIVLVLKAVKTSFQISICSSHATNATHQLTLPTMMDSATFHLVRLTLLEEETKKTGSQLERVPSSASEETLVTKSSTYKKNGSAVPVPYGFGFSGMSLDGAPLKPISSYAASKSEKVSAKEAAKAAKKAAKAAEKARKAALPPKRPPVFSGIGVAGGAPSFSAAHFYQPPSYSQERAKTSLEIFAPAPNPSRKDMQSTSEAQTPLLTKAGLKTLFGKR